MPRKQTVTVSSLHEPDRLLTAWPDTFCKLCQQASIADYPNLKALYRGASLAVRYTTCIDHLNQVASFFLGKEADHHVLFAVQGLTGFHPTEPALRIFTFLQKIDNNILNAKAECQHIHDKDKAVIHFGASNSIGLHLLPSIFSNSPRIFDADLSIQPEFGNTTELIHKLAQKQLQFIVSFGDKPAKGDINFDNGEKPTEADIAFKSYCPLRLVLVCSRYMPLMDVRGRDRNKNYPSRRTRQLPHLSLDEIDFTHHRLVVTPSWWRKPLQLNQRIAELRRNGRVQEASRFQDAVAFARMEMGLAVVTEDFAHNKHVNAFALTPVRDYRKWIGVYYHAKRGLTVNAARVATYIGLFLKQYALGIPVGAVPRSDNVIRQRWQREFANRDWQRHTRQHFRTKIV